MTQDEHPATAPGAGDPRKRWDNDERYAGVADASAFATAIGDLAALARRPGWVAEDPELHLVPHLRRADVAGLRLVSCAAGADGVLEVAADYSPGASRGEIRHRAWMLIAAISESATSVHERADGNTFVFDVVTGIPDGAGHFVTHGHTVRLTLHSAP